MNTCRVLPLFFLIGIGTTIAFFTAGAVDVPTPSTPSTSGSNAIRIYNCDQAVQSSKRGLCANNLSAEDIQALAPGVSWYSNWHFTTNDPIPTGVHFDFIPTAFGRADSLAGLTDYLAKHPKPRFVLAINEPNIGSQAFLSPKDTAALYCRIKALADRYGGVPVIGPNMAMGSLPEDSVTAVDPIEKKQVTYGFMVPFLKAFNYYMGDIARPAVAFHTFGNMGELKWAVGMMHQTFNKPVWVTEYAQWRNVESNDALDYLVKATDYLESSPDVGGYAWFKERLVDNPSLGLLTGESGKLTLLGDAYVALPVHDADVYYRVPGRLPADHYVTATSAEIEVTHDESGKFDMATYQDGVLDYNIQVDKAGSFKLKLRVSGPKGAIDIKQNDQVLATANSKTPYWHDETAAVKLAAGPQTLRIHTTGQSLNWIEFKQQ